jgi:uncharacterized protein (TIGR00369 family)
MRNLKENIIIQEYINWNRFGVLLGMDFTIPQAGEVIYTMKVTEDMLATPFAAHGGSVAALLDATLGVACLSQVCEDLKVVSTVNISIQYMSPACLNDVLTATGKVIKAGNRILFVEGKVVNQDEVLIATASATMNAYPVAKISEKLK